jgi:cell division transport system ATP-binding protein
MKIIELKSVTIYQNKEAVLQDVDFQLSEGEMAYLIGRTGSGKSSLLKTLYGELPLMEGEGNVSEFDLRNLKRKQIPFLRRKIGIVFQDFQLLMDRTVLENLLFVMQSTGWNNKSLMEKRAMDLMEMVGIGHKANQMPHKLSGGEQQRVSIARALVNHPELILADEPTGNLDGETSEEIMRLIMAVAKETNAAVLMATHDLDIVEKFPGRVIRIEDGHLKEVDAIHHFDPFKPLF